MNNEQEKKTNPIEIHYFLLKCVFTFLYPQLMIFNIRFSLRFVFARGAFWLHVLLLPNRTCNH